MERFIIQLIGPLAGNAYCRFRTRLSKNPIPGLTLLVVAVGSDKSHAAGGRGPSNLALRWKTTRC
jgi:hypothetical protein